MGGACARALTPVSLDFNPLRVLLKSQPAKNFGKLGHVLPKVDTLTLEGDPKDDGHQRVRSTSPRSRTKSVDLQVEIFNIWYK